jgi:uncharacterized protein with NRDE domain
VCLVALALDPGHRFPIVIAANRDEYFARPTAPLDWWSPSPGDAPILAGRDLEAGGTWLGLSTAGRFGFVTNVRGMMANDPAAPSRGVIVPQWLTSAEPADRFWPRTANAGHNGFNLVAADFVAGECFWASNCADEPVRLGPGLHAVSNHLLDTPWPKLLTLKSLLGAAVDECDSLDGLIGRLFDALADPAEAPVDQLPSTGITPDRERRLSPAFIRMADIGYGTRCSTVLVVEQQAGVCTAYVIERSFELSGISAQTRRMSIDHWPPVRHSGNDSALDLI